MGTLVQVFVHNASRMTVLTSAENLVVPALCYKLVVRYVIFKVALETDGKAVSWMRGRNSEAEQDLFWDR